MARPLVLLLLAFTAALALSSVAAQVCPLICLPLVRTAEACPLITGHRLLMQGSPSTPACHTYTSAGLITPAVGSLQDVIVVQDAFPVGAAPTVAMDVSHPRIGALKISLSAQPFSTSSAQLGTAVTTLVLKSRGQGRCGAGGLQCGGGGRGR